MLALDLSDYTAKMYPPPIKSSCDDAVINGVHLPHQVREELRMLGLSLSWYSPGELQDAVIACAYDSQLVDDDEGVDFRDKLKLTDSERKAHIKRDEKSKCPFQLASCITYDSDFDENTPPHYGSMLPNVTQKVGLSISHPCH